MLDDDIKLAEAIGEMKAQLATVAEDVKEVKTRLGDVEKHVNLVRAVTWFLRCVGATVIALLTLDWTNISKLWHH